MQLTKIVLKNYGVYRDKVEFDLTTTDEKPVVLIGGTNGAGKTTLFDQLPSKCSSCEKKFPKTQEAHNTWRVVVKYEKQEVRLFCPECQEKAKELVENNNEV